MSALRKVTAAAAVTLILPALYAGNAVGVTPTPSPTPSPTDSATPTPTDSATPSPTPTDSSTATPTASPSPSATGTASLDATVSADIAPAATNELGVVGTPPSHIDFPSGNSVDATADGALSWSSGAYCMKNDGSGSCDWGGTLAPVSFTGVYSDDAVANSLGTGLRMGYESIDTMCKQNLAVDGNGKVLDGQVIDCNGGNPVGTMTFTFAEPVTDAVLHVHNIGGSAGYGWNVNGPGHFDNEWVAFWPTLSPTTAGVTLAPVTTRGNISVTPTSIGVISDLGTGIDVANDYGQVWGYPLPSTAYGSITGVASPGSSYTMGSGSVHVSSASPITSVTFDVSYAFGVVDIVDGFSFTRDELAYASDFTEFLWSLGDGSAGPSDQADGAPVAPQYTLTYDANGGSCAAPSQTEDTGTWVNTRDASSCTREGYTFLGWNTSAAGGGLGFTPGAPTQITGDNTLYAQWEEATPILAVDDADTTPYETPITDTVATNDTYPAGSRFTKLTDPANGTVDFSSNGSFTYRPNPGFWGTDSFDYRVCAPDSTTRCAEATQAITVPEPGDPAATPRRTVITAGDVSPVPFSPNGSSSPAPGSRLKDGVARIAPLGTSNWGTRIVIPGKGTWRVVDGEVTFTPLPSFIGKVRIRYQVQDANGTYADSTFTVITSSVPGTIDGGR